MGNSFPNCYILLYFTKNEKERQKERQNRRSEHFVTFKNQLWSNLILKCKIIILYEHIELNKNVFWDVFCSENLIPHNAINVNWINDNIRLPLNHLVISNFIEFCSFNIQNAIRENSLPFVGILDWCICFILKFRLKA